MQGTTVVTAVQEVLARTRSFLRALFQRDQLESEMDAELSEHLECLTAEMIAEGHSEAEARRQARLVLGPLEVHKEEMRSSLGLRWWDEARTDLHHALRLIRRSPTLTAAAVLLLSLVIGANTAIFSVGKHFLLGQLHVRHPEQLRLLGWNGDRNTVKFSYRFGTEEFGMTGVTFSYPVFRELRARDRAFDGLIAFTYLETAGAVNGVAQPLTAELVTGEYFEVLGISPQLGRTIQSGDESGINGGAVAVISDDLWQQQFGRSPAALGQTIVVGQAAATIVGVSTRDFTGARSPRRSPDLFLPISMFSVVQAPFMAGMPPLMRDPGFWRLTVMGRMRAGANEERTRQLLNYELESATRATLPLGPGQTAPQAAMTEGRRGERVWDRRFRRPIPLLLGLAMSILLLACANIANLLLARGIERQSELCVRFALGATRARVVRQLFTESLATVFLGGTGGLVLGYLGRKLLPRLLSPYFKDHALGVPFDWVVFAFVAGIAILTAMGTGLAPAWITVRHQVASSLKLFSGALTRVRSWRSSYGLVGLQIALSTVLVIGAGLFVRTLMQLHAVDAGFRRDHLLLIDTEPARLRAASAGSAASREQVQRALEAVPGVDSVARMSGGLLTGGTGMMVILSDVEAALHQQSTFEIVNFVDNHFFPTMSVPLLAGRGFSERDTIGSPQVAVINQSLAKAKFPGCASDRKTCGGPASRGAGSRGPADGAWHGRYYLLLRTACLAVGLHRGLRRNGLLGGEPEK